MLTTLLRASAIAILFAGAAAAQAPPGGRPPAPPLPEFAQVKAVPHGEVRIVWYDSKAFGAQRRMHIYLPPGYDRGAARYPVLYLIHGGGQDDAAWIDDGRAEYILDNLLAAGRIQPMIVVMPNGGPQGPGPGPGEQANTPEALAARAKAASEVRDTFVDDLMTAVIPYVDAAYRTKAGRNDRAIAGFSYGGAETLWAGTDHLDRFSSIGVFSMGVQGGSAAGAGAIAGSGSAGAPEDFVKAHAAFFADPARTNSQVKLFWIGVGADDRIVVDGPRQLDEVLTAHGIRHEYHQSPGGHDMTNWRDYLRDFASMLFR